jgi:hypothetical protein
MSMGVVIRTVINNMTFFLGNGGSFTYAPEQFGDGD